MLDELTLSIKTTFESVQSANDTASQWLAERGASPDMQYFANLAIEELVTNCIKYGFDDNEDHLIEVRLSVSASSIAVIVMDDGRPFNPLVVPDPDTSLPLEERPIGGLGIHLLRRMSDEIEYVREGNKNRVTLRKTLGGRTNSP